VLSYFIGDQFDYFKRRGVDFYVACSPSEDLLEYAKLKEFTAFPLPIHKKITLVADLRTIRSLVRIIKDHHIDIVVGHTPKGALLAMTAARIAGVQRRIYFRHGLLYESSRGLKRGIFKYIERLTGSLATQVVCVSHSVLKLSNSERLSTPSKNLILHKGTCNGIDYEFTFNPQLISEAQINALRQQHGIKQQDRVVGFVGRLVNDKGIGELINAWKILLAREKNIKLLLIGPPEKRDAIGDDLKGFIEAEKSIIYVGLVRDMAPYYRLMDVFILPSRREGFPTVVLEASAMEIPVITTKATGCIDAILEDETGVFTSLIPSEMSEKMQMYLNDQVLAKTHGRNGRQFIVDNFGQLSVWQEIGARLFGCGVS